MLISRGWSQESEKEFKELCEAMKMLYWPEYSLSKYSAGVQAACKRLRGVPEIRAANQRCVSRKQPSTCYFLMICILVFRVSLVVVLCCSSTLPM